MALDLKWAIGKPVFSWGSTNPNFLCNLTVCLLISLPSFARHKLKRRPEY